ncbi:hypothetical protein EVAR_88600_1 [Eumeta japonica]|uniref:Uncharacterized protein n=1 Tax=Eumeta variegata TaxID=151549 RepID=A0A4C2A6E6_EUMVA|nr:hypothetical protein EVAR_88600_1 [Eumeta japonica]
MITIYGAVCIKAWNRIDSLLEGNEWNNLSTPQRHGRIVIGSLGGYARGARGRGAPNLGRGVIQRPLQINISWLAP